MADSPLPMCACGGPIPDSAGPDWICPGCGAAHPDALVIEATTATCGDPDVSIRTCMPTDELPGGRVPRPRRTAPAACPDPDADFLIGEFLGRGGIGQVHAATQTTLGRQVAIKRLRPERHARPGARARFLAEATVTATLDHPGIVPVHDLGLDSEGHPFYAMKLIASQPWQASIDQIGRDANLEILLKICDALAYAHSKGVIHRDLKPGNVMVGPFGEVLVVDWGLALAIGEGAPVISAAVARAGTPTYMAPEMALGDAGRIGIASDVYLLGGVLLRIITGKVPHPGQTAGAAIAAAARNELAKLPESDPLSAVALRALASDPAGRYADARAFKAAVREAVEHEESLSLVLRADLDLARSRSLPGHACFAESVQACREALRLWPENPSAQRILAQARLAWAERACELGDFDLASSQTADARDPLAVELGRRIAALRTAAERRRERARILSIAAIALGGMLLVVIGVLSFLAWRNERALGETTQAGEIARLEVRDATRKAQLLSEASAEHERQRSRAFVPYAQAMDLLRRGQEAAEAERLLLQALEIAPDLAQAWYALGDARRQAGRADLAAEAYLRADQASRDVLGQANLQALFSAAICLDETGDTGRASELLRRTARIGGDHPYAELSRANLLLQDLRPDDSLAILDRLAATAPHLWEVHLLRGSALLGQLDQGRMPPGPLVEQAIASLRTAYEMAPRQATCAYSLANAILKRGHSGDLTECRRLHTLALALEPENPSQAVNLLLSSSHAVLGAQLFATICERINSAHLDLPIVLVGKSRLRHEAGDHEGAARLIDQCIAKSGPSPNLITLQMYLYLGLSDRREEVLQRIRALQAAGKDWIELRMLSCKALLEAGDTAGADAESAQALVTHPWNSALLYFRYLIETRSGRWTEAAELARRMVLSEPFQPISRVMLATAMARLDRRVEAKAELDWLASNYPELESLPAIRRDLLKEAP